MLSNENCPYVVTNDLEIVFPQLSFSEPPVPLNGTITSASDIISSALRKVFTKVDIIDASVIKRYLESQLLSQAYPSVSLTGLLSQNVVTAMLELSRSAKSVSNCLGKKKFETIGLCPRFENAPPVSDQLDVAACLIKNKSSKAVIIDDVVFSGGTIINIAQEFNKRGVVIDGVVASVAIKQGRDSLESKGIKVSADTVYDQVHDEICMRDFIVGAPGGGRNIISDEGKFESAPYILPFGNMADWASMPDEVQLDFSRAALDASIMIWDDIDKMYGVPVKVSKLKKPIIGLDLDRSLSSQLKEIRMEMGS